MNQETGETWYDDDGERQRRRSVGTVSYAYDAEGNMTSAANTAELRQRGDYTYQYDGVGQRQRAKTCSLPA